MTETFSRSVAGPARVDRAGWAALLTGTAIIAWSGVLARFLDVGPLAGAAWRMGLAAPALAVWSRAERARAQATSRATSPPSRLPLALSGLAFAVDVGSFHMSLTGTNVANASFIGNVAPILAMVGGALFFRERAAPRRVAGAGAGARRRLDDGGHGLAAGRQMGRRLRPQRGVAYAAYLMFIKRARARLDGPTATLVSAVVSAFLLAGAAAARGEKLVPIERARLDDRLPARLRQPRDGTGPDLGGARPDTGGAGRSGPARPAAGHRAHRLGRARTKV